MSSTFPRLSLFLALSILLAACGSPTTPSRSTNATPPAGTPARGITDGGLDPALAQPSGGITFIGSDPAPGGETVLTDDACCLYLKNLKVQLAVHFGSTLPDAKVEAELFTDTGVQCAFTFVDQPIAANHTVTVSIDQLWVWNARPCDGLAVDTVSLKVTLLTLRDTGSGGKLQRTDYVIQTFPVRYTIRRYPPPPPNPPEAPPTITSLAWTSGLPIGGDPIPGDGVSVGCVGSEADGAAVTVKITVQWDRQAPVTHTKAFPAGASSSPSGAGFGIFTVATNPAHAKVECVVTNDRGHHAVKTIDIGFPG